MYEIAVENEEKKTIRGGGDDDGKVGLRRAKLGEGSVHSLTPSSFVTN
jgi:hypothetical protein